MAFGIVVLLALFLCGSATTYALNCSALPIMSYDYLVDNHCTQLTGSVSLSQVHIIGLDASVTDLQALASLSSFSCGAIVVANNSGLTSLSGIFFGVTSLLLSNNTVWIDMQVAVQVRSIVVRDHPRLVTLAISSPVYGTTEVTGNPHLQIFTVQPPTLTPLYELRVTNNPGLQTLSLGSHVPSVLTLILSELGLAGIGSITACSSTIENMPQLQALTIHVVGSPNGVTVRNNPSLQSLSIQIGDESTIQNLAVSNQDRLTTLISTATSYATLVLSGNPLLTSLQGFSSLQSAGTVSILNNTGLTRLFTGAKQLASINQLTLTNNTALQSLEGLTGTLVTHLDMEGELALWDYSEIASWSPLPATFSLARVCCPSRAFFNAALEWTTDDFAHCQDCVTLSNLSATLGPNTGGIFLTLLASGPIESDTIEVSVDGGENFVSCPVTDAGLSCVTPSSNQTGTYALQFQVDPSRPILLTSRNVVFTTVNFSEFVGHDWNDTALFPTSSFSDGRIPGLISTDQTLGTNGSAETILILSGVTTAVFISLVLSLHLCCQVDVGHSLRLVKCDWYGVLAEAGRADVALGRLLRRRRSAIGGVVSIGVVFWMFVLVATVLYVYKTDNLQTEILNLPIDTSRPLASNYQIRMSFLTTHIDCSTGFTYHVTGVDGAYRLTTATTLTGGCDLVLDCPSCDIPSGTAQVSIKSDDPNSFVVAMNWSISSTDYFGQPSTVSGTTAAAFGSLFRGRNPATILTVSANPGVFEAMDGTDQHGVLMKFVGIVLGEQVTPETFADGADGFGVTLVMPGVGSTIHVQVLAKQSALALFAQVLAIISGLVNGGSALVVFLQWMHNRAGIGVRDEPELEAHKQPLSSNDSLEVMVEATPASGGRSQRTADDDGSIN